MGFSDFSDKLIVLDLKIPIQFNVRIWNTDNFGGFENEDISNYKAFDLHSSKIES